MLQTYADLADQGEHLLASLLEGQVPVQWRHYPPDDAFDRRRGWQWFYHSHSAEDRPGDLEHGHIHLFARRQLWGRRLQSRPDQSFNRLTGNSSGTADTRHLVAIGLDAKGVPTSLFTVNSWVTGDLMLSARLTLALLNDLALDSGHCKIDHVITSLVQLYLPEIGQLLEARDRSLAQWKEKSEGQMVLSDERLEILSTVSIDVDSKLASLPSLTRRFHGGSPHHDPRRH